MKRQGILRATAFIIFTLLHFYMVFADDISKDVMQRIYDEVRTPYKYGLVVAPTDNYHKID